MTGTSAIESLYRRHGGAVYRRCLRFLGSHAEAEVAVQEVFLRILRKLDGLVEPERAANYLFRISTNYCIKRLRSMARKAAHEVSDAEMEGNEDTARFGGEDPERRVGSRALLRRCIGLASGRMQEVVLLFFLEEMTLEEVGRELSMTPQHAGRLVKRFRERVLRERPLLEESA